MQKVIWSGQGEGTTDLPFILETDVDFNIQLPFNIEITTNYVAAQPEFTYFKFDNSITVYMLAHVITNRDSLMYIEGRDAIKITMFLTTFVNILEGPYQITSSGGSQYLLKQQVFDPSRSATEGYYRGLWVSGQSYDVNDIVIYDGITYQCIEFNHDEVFTESKWNLLSGFKAIEQTRDPLPSDYNYPIGSIWVNTDGKRHFILVNADGNIATWNLSSINPDNETLGLNGNLELEIKDKTIEGGEW